MIQYKTKKKKHFRNAKNRVIFGKRFLTFKITNKH